MSACCRHRPCPCRERARLTTHINRSLIEFHCPCQGIKRRLVSRSGKKNSEPPVEIRQLRERRTRRTRRCDLLRKRDFLLLHCIQEKMVQMALSADGGHILLKCRTRIDECGCILPKAVIGIGKVAAVAGQKPRLLHAPLHEQQISFMLGADTSRRVSHMTDRRKVRLMIENRLSPLFCQSLMHAPFIVKATSEPQEANMRRTPHLPPIRVLVDVYDRQKHGIHMGHRHIHHREIGAQLCGVKERLIGIENNRPFSVRRSDGGIACGGKIIPPGEILHRRPCRHGKGARPIRPPRIDDNTLIRIDSSIF